MREIATSIEIDAPPEQVWDVLTDFPAHAQWNPLFSSISGRATVGETITVHARKPSGGTFRFRARILTADRARQLRWRGKLLVRGLFDGTHEFLLSPLPGGRTRLDHREQFRGVLIPLLGKVLRDTHTGFTAFDRALAARSSAHVAERATTEEARR